MACNHWNLACVDEIYWFLDNKHCGFLHCHRWSLLLKDGKDTYRGSWSDIFCVLAMGIKSRVCYWQFLKPSILLSCNVVDVVKPWIIRDSCPWICCECWQSWSIGHCGKTDFSSTFVNVGLWHSGKVFREMDSGVFKSIKSESWRRDPSVFMSEMVCQWNGSTWSSVRPD